MTTSYDPFAPAGGVDPAEYGGRRRAEDPWAAEAVEPGWGSELAAPNGTVEDWSTTRADYPVAGYAPGPAPGFAPSGSPVPAHPPADAYPPAHAYPRADAYPPADAYAPAAGHLPDRPVDPASGPPGTPGHVPTGPPPPAPHHPRIPIRPSAVVMVAVLLVVGGWQAYRIEGVTRDNQTLVSGLSAERDRTDKLARQLAGVFDPEAVSSQVLPSVFRVRAGDFTGTAFSVGDRAPDGRSNLLTNYHVVAQVWTGGGRKVSLERGNTRISATIVKVSKGKDLAWLQAAQTISPLSTAGGQVRPGQQVVVVGAPLGLDDTVTSGVISAYRPNDPDGPTIQFDAPINPGNSGGPVVNAGQQVVGLATAKAKDAEGIGLAIPIKTACDTFAVC
jgi:putative serine protease PepD